MRHSRIVFAMLATSLMTDVSFANGNFYPFIPASACQLESGPYKFSGGKVTFAGTRMGTIVLTCPLDNNQYNQAATDAMTSFATYRDAGPAPATRSIKVNVLERGMDGAFKLTEVMNSKLEKASNGVHIEYGSAPPLPTDGLPVFHYYMVQVVLKRASASQIVEFYGMGFGD